MTEPITETVMRPTSELRWLSWRRADSYGQKLQQKWREADHGMSIALFEEWRDVPIVKEE